MASSWYKRLGNMVLLEATKNTKIGNKGFDEKKQTLIESQYLTTQAAGKYVDWGPNEIRERQVGLAKYVPKVWPI